MRPFRSSLAALFAAAIVLTLVDVSRVSAAAIGAGNIVVIRVGDGATTATGTALPVTLDEYSVTYTGTAPTGVTLVQSIPLPTGALGTAPSSGQRYLAQGGTAGGEGGLALSSNGLYMTLAGYNSGLGDPTNAGTVGTEDRVVGRLDLATGVCDTSTVLVGFAATNAIRNAFTTNGTDIWTATSTGGNGAWRATVTTAVHRSDEQPVAGATVAVSWSGGWTKTASCVTNSVGQCTFKTGPMNAQQTSVTLTVTSLSAPLSVYDPAANHSQVAGATGPSVTIRKP